MMAPQIYAHSKSVNVTLLGKRVFPEIIKLKILRWDHLGLEWALNILYVCIYVIYVYITYIYTYK